MSPGVYSTLFEDLFTKSGPSESFKSLVTEPFRFTKIHKPLNYKKITVQKQAMGYDFFF